MNFSLKTTNYRDLKFIKGNGVSHTEKINSYTKNLIKKRLGSSHKAIFFISKKNSVINEFTHKIKTVFFPNSIHNSLNMALSLIIKQNFSNIFIYLDWAWWVEQIDKGINVTDYFNFQIQFCV